MSSYGSMSPSEERFEQVDSGFYMPHPGMNADDAVVWAGSGDSRGFDSRELYSSHYDAAYGYEDVIVNSNEAFDVYPNYPSDYQQINSCFDVDYSIKERQPPPYVRVVKRRTTANKKERRRTQSINTAFSDLRDCIPNVPADTKLSKIKTLRLATSYISYLLKVLETDGEPVGGFRAELHPPIRRRGDSTNSQIGVADKRGKGRTGWPQHVWALELKSDQNF